MKHTTITLIFAAAALLAGCAAAFGTPGAADTSGYGLDGTWIQTGDPPRASLRFKGKNVRFKNLHGVSGSVEYQVREKNADGVTIGIYYTYEKKDRDGEKRNEIFAHDFRLHVENGRPILSEEIFEYDGRGLMIWEEFLRKEDFIEGFESERKRTLNNRAPMPSMMPQECMMPQE